MYIQFLLIERNRNWWGESRVRRAFGLDANANVRLAGPGRVNGGVHSKIAGPSQSEQGLSENIDQVKFLAPDLRFL